MLCYHRPIMQRLQQLTAALALCYSVAEYCCPVWARSSYTNLIYTQLHSSMRLISGCLQPTHLSCLPVLSNVAPPALRRKAATDNMLQIIEAHPHWPVYADVFEGGASTFMACISTPNVVRHDIYRHNYAVERGLVNGFCGQPHHCYRPYYPTARFPSPSSYMVSDESFPCCANC